MAEGLVLLLVGEDVHKKNDLIRLEKVYEVEVLTGVATDSYDILGKIVKTTGIQIDKKFFLTKAEKLIDVQEQAYPPFSSKTVSGNPLWQWQREGKIHKVDIPTRPVQISKIRYLGNRTYDAYELESLIVSSIKKVSGDFRQSTIIEGWRNFFARHQQRYQVHSLEISVSSGTYIRGLVHVLGEMLGAGAVSIKIKRTRIGSFTKSIDK